MDTQKLLLVIADSSRTGAPQQVLYLARGMKDQYAVEVVCPAGWLQDELRAIGIPTHLWPKGGAVALIRRLGRLYTSVQPSIIHCHGVRAGIVGRLARIPQSSRVLYTEHLWTKDFHLQSYARQWLQLSLLRWCTLKTDHTIAVSHAVLKFLEQNIIVGAGMASVIYGAIEPLTATKPSTAPVIGTIGHLTWVKGVDTLIRALPMIKQRYPHLSCVIAGEGPDLPRLQRLAHRLEVSDIIRWETTIKDKAMFFHHLRVYVQPSLSESFGMAPLEAMSMGVPAIVSDAGALPEIVRDNRDGLVVPRADEHALADAVIQYLSDAALFNKLQKAGRNRALEFTITRMVQEYQQIYKALGNHV